MSAPDLGFGFDRTDTTDEPTTPTALPAGVDGYPTGYRSTVIHVPMSACCGALPGDVDECAEFAAEAVTAPVIRHPFNLRQLREQHLTAADLERGEAA